MYAASLYDVYLREKDMEGNGKERKYCILFQLEGRYLHFLSFSLLRRHVFQRRTSSIPFQNMKVKSPHDTSKHWTVYRYKTSAGAYFFRGKNSNSAAGAEVAMFFSSRHTVRRTVGHCTTKDGSQIQVVIVAAISPPRFLYLIISSTVFAISIR